MDKQLTERRSFLTRMQLGAAAVAAALGGSAIAQGKSKGSARWEPARHEKDSWLAELPGKHRFVFDTTLPKGFDNALMFANNYLIANKKDYGLQNSDLALIIVARHLSTPFAYNNAMWAKYGPRMASLASYEDPKSKVPPTVNPFNHDGQEATAGALAKDGVQFAVCSMATRRLADLIAQPLGVSGEPINSELVANLVANARMVPAGIVVLNRAQEYGYSLVSA